MGDIPLTKRAKMANAVVDLILFESECKMAGSVTEVEASSLDEVDWGG